MVDLMLNIAHRNLIRLLAMQAVRAYREGERPVGQLPDPPTPAPETYESRPVRPVQHRAAIRRIR